MAATPLNPALCPPVRSYRERFASSPACGRVDETAEQLTSETQRWADRLDEALDEAQADTEQGRSFLENVRAYRADADHFAGQEDHVRAFEAVVWAWAWLEIGARIEAIDWRYPEDGFEP